MTATAFVSARATGAAPRSAALAVLGLLLGLLPAACATTPAIPDEPIFPPVSFRQREMRLSSGLRILIQEDRGAPLVAIATVVTAGTRDDPAGNEGLAHLVEHLSYRAVVPHLKRAGATYNATTEVDRTTYFAMAPRDQLEELVRIEGERLAQPLRDATAPVLEVERDVVRNEHRQRGGNPRILGELFRDAFGTPHRMGRAAPPGGQSLGNVTLEVVQAFVAQHYRPANTTVVIAGDIDEAKLTAALDRWDAALLTSATPVAARLASAPRALSPAAPTKEIRRLALPVSDRRLIIAWPAPAARRANDPLLLTSLAALDARLHWSEWELATRSRPVLLAAEDGSLLAIEVRLKPDEDAEKAREQVLDAANNIRSDAVSRRTIALLRYLTGMRIVRGSTDLLRNTVAVAQHLSATGRSSFYKDTLSELSAIDPMAVRDFLWDQVTRQRARSWLIEPSASTAFRAGTQEEENEEPSFVVASDTLPHDLPSAPAVSLAGIGNDEVRAMVRSPRLSALPRFRLDSGLEVVVVPAAPGRAVSELMAQLSVGDFELAPFGVADLAADVSEGTCRTEDYLFEVGGRLNVSGGDLRRLYSVEVLAGNVENGLVALANSLRCRELLKNASNLTAIRFGVQEAVIDKVAKAPGVQAAHTFWRTLYPDGAYGPYSRDLPALKRVDERTLQAVLRAQFHPGGTLLVAVTDRPPTELRPLLERHLGAWKEAPAPQVTRAPAATPPAVTRSVNVYQQEKAGLARLRIGCRLAPAAVENLASYDVLEALVRREANEVRAAWGATYGLAVNVMIRPRGIAHLTVEGSVDPARVGDATNRMLGFLQRLASDGPDIKSFLLERWDVGREFNHRFATGEGVAGAVLNASQMGWSPAVFDEYPEHLATLSRAAIRELVAPCAGHEVITIVGDKQAASNRLQELGVK